MTPNELNEARQKLGLSIQQMADAMDVHRDTWGKWARGDRKPDRAAVQLVRLMVWLHDNRAATLAKWLDHVG